MAVQYQVTTPTPGFDYEMIETTTTVYHTVPAPYMAEGDDVSTALLNHPSMVEEHQAVVDSEGQFFPPPREFFSELPTRWRSTRSLMPWATPEIRDEWGNVCFEAKLNGLFLPEAKLVSNTTGLVSYSYASTGWFEWKHPYNIYVGTDSSEMARPYAAVIRGPFTLAGIRLSFRFATGEPTLELEGNWCNRRFTLSRGTVAIASIRRRRFMTYEYTIAAGENIPLINLMVQLLSSVIIRERR